MLPDGEIAEKYELLGKLDEGGMGEIYKVRHRLLDEVRVIKLIRHHHAGDPELQERFLREARTAIQLRHPNIAEIFDFSIDPRGVACIVMEHIDGLDLKRMLTSGAPPVPLALEIASQALRALGFLHARGFVHRDISPDNLMLTSDHEGQPLVKLIDLGIAKRLSGEAKALTATGMFVGKMQYAAPEQFDRDIANSPKSDLYSFGVLLYELLTSRCPIVGANLTELITAHVLHPPLPFEQTDPRGRVCEGLRAEVLRALEKKPELRHADAEAFAAALAPFRAPDTLAADLEATFALDVDQLRPLPGIPVTDATAAPHPTTRTVTLDPAALDPARRGAPSPERVIDEEVAEYHRAARERLDAGDPDAGAELARRALDLDPERTEVRAVLDDAEQAIELRRIQERHARAVVDARASIEAQLASGALREAREALDRASAQLGAGPVWETLGRRLRRAEAVARQEQIDAAVADARALLDEERDDDARRRLDDAFALVGDHGEATRLLATLKARREAAERELEAERAAARAHGVRELVVEARALLADRRHRQAADLLRIVLELDPGHEEASRLLAELPPG